MIRFGHRLCCVLLGMAWTQSVCFDLRAQTPAAPPPTTTAPATMQSSTLTEAMALEDDLQQGILAQPMGGYPVAALNLPDDFVRRVRDRRLIDIYRGEFRKIEAPPNTPPLTTNTTTASAAPSTTQNSFPSVHWDPLPEISARRRAYRPGRPEARGFKAPILTSQNEAARMTLPDNLTTEWQQAGDIVASRLARDGLLLTLAQVMEQVGSAAFLAKDANGLEKLGEIGFPTDLLIHFSTSSDPAQSAPEVLRALATRLAGAPQEGGRAAVVAGFQFRYNRKHAFVLAEDSGGHNFDLFRMQAPSQKIWEPGPRGDVLDVARQLLDACPDAHLLICVNQSDASALRSVMADWKIRAERLMIVEESLPVAQWAHDNGKPGWMHVGNEWRSATLVPRYGSQNEDGSVFVPNESFVADDWVAAGQSVIQAPLLFQGGNFICVNDRARGRRVLLIGEAEIYRNVALGLSRAQAIDAFRVEFGVDECVVLPGPSFHIDLDITVRTLADGQVVALVNDARAAAVEIARSGFRALQHAGLLSPADARELTAALDQGNDAQFRGLMRAKFKLPLNDAGQFTAALAGAFGEPIALDGIPNLHVFLAAMDTLLLDAPEFLPPDNPYALAYSRAMQRQRDDQRALLDALRPLGWKIVAVPGLSAANDSVCYLNGLHDQSHFFVPFYGDFYGGVDQVAVEAIQRELPGVKVLPVRTTAVERRAGGVRCVTAAYGPHAD